jgi:hypothetical protein
MAHSFYAEDIVLKTNTLTDDIRVIANAPLKQLPPPTLSVSAGVTI